MNLHKHGMYEAHENWKKNTLQVPWQIDLAELQQCKNHFSAKQEKPSCFLWLAMQSGKNSQKSHGQMHKHKKTEKHKKLQKWGHKVQKVHQLFSLTFFFQLFCGISLHFLALSKENHWNSRFQNCPILISQPNDFTTKPKIEENLRNFLKESTLNWKSLKFCQWAYPNWSLTSLFFWVFFAH